MDRLLPERTVQRGLSFILIVGSALCGTAKAAAMQAREAVVCHVDPRVELMSVIFHLAGSPEYSQGRVAEYARTVDEHFSQFFDHAVVKRAQALRKSRGIAYDAVMSMAIHLVDAKDLVPVIPLGAEWTELDSRWNESEAQEFLKEARLFAKESEFRQFFEEQSTLYALTENRLQALLDAELGFGWFDDFFGARPASRLELVPALLTGGNSYGPRVRFHQNREDLYCVLGVWLTDEEGHPRFDRTVLPTVVHEFCHSYCNPLVEEHREALRNPAARIFQHVAGSMRRMAYARPEIMIEESLVRACVVQWAASAGGESARIAEIEAQRKRGFPWVGGLSEVLKEHERAAEDSTEFASVMPKVVDFFERLSLEYPEEVAVSPEVVRVQPTNGDKKVSPDLSAITVTFDRPMLDRSWSFVRGGAAYPEASGKPSYDESGTTITLPVKLEPNQRYEIWLNRGRYDSFRSREGGVLEPYRLEFETAER